MTQHDHEPLGTNDRVSVRTDPFQVGKKYSRQMIQELLGLQPMRGGDWATGHHREGNDTYIFATVGEPGRTGHDYNNRWDGSEFHWESKSTQTRSSQQVKAMCSPPGNGRVLIFTRYSSREPFVFEGVGVPMRVEGDKPVKIVWRVLPERQRGSD